MATEAAVVRQNALANIPDASRHDEADLIRLLDTMDIDTGLETCGRWFGTNIPALPLLQKIAGLLVLTQRWERLESMPQSLPLLADAPAAKMAAIRMHDGDWEAALKALTPVRRNSPYAPVRLLCRAMVCFYADDHEAMHRALGMIPPHCPFYAVSKAMGRDALQIDCLWDRRICSETDVQALMAHLKKRRIDPAAAVIGEMARSVAPGDPDRAALDILMALLPLTLNDRLQPDNFRRLAEAVLSAPWAEVAEAKLGYYHFDHSLLDTARYLDALETEIDDKPRQLKAASILLTHTVARMEKTGIPFEPQSLLPRYYRGSMGINSDDPEINGLEVLIKAIELDPENRMAYELLAKGPRYTREAKALVEAGLEKMMSVFTEDPLPCLELAALFHEKNA